MSGEGMSEEGMSDEAPRDEGLATRLLHPLVRASRAFEGLATPVYRASTVLFADMADVGEDRPSDSQYRYGLHGTPTYRELAARIAQSEGAHSVELVPSGLNAIALTYLALCKAGDHVLLPRNAYGPNGRAGRFLARLGIEIESYDPLVGEGIAAQIRENTSLVWIESPGSISMEVPDLPAIARAAHARGALVALDNTYAAGVLLDGFGHGADVCVQALTKYQAGHGDVLMGSASARDPAIAARLAEARHVMGLGASPDDCALVLRGLATFPLRLKHVGTSALRIAEWLKARPEVARVLHPALPGCPGHDVWKRDFTGSAGIFSIVLASETSGAASRFVDSLRLFKIGYSWGGTVSLALTYPDLDRPSASEGPRLVRLNIGLEDAEDLLADLDQAFDAIR
ncbi:cystathionine beta-lyase [Sphingomonas sp. ASV193]|uniref:cystathionine beta-lyase n=1 Tax=Sphingomonas sp. ASV193 TaxID=3144405 RepID=UPI0032E8EFB8